MKTFIKPNSKLKTGLLSGVTTLALLGTPTAAFAHGSHHNWGRKWVSPRVSQVQCERWEADLNQKVERYRNQLQDQVNKQNEWFTKIQAHVADNGLTVENYEMLNTAASEKQTAASEAVGAVEEADLNCEDRSKRTKAREKQAHKELNNQVHEAKQTIREYKQSVQTLLVAVIES